MVLWDFWVRGDCSEFSVSLDLVTKMNEEFGRSFNRSFFMHDFVGQENFTGLWEEGT